MEENLKTPVTKVTAKSTSDTATNEISRVAVTAFVVLSALIGLWAVACMASGILSSGGPVALLSSLFGAILG